jgi:uracil phosphoribosyltransferase
MHYNLCDTDTIANQFLLRLRDKTVQTDRSEFRRNLQRLGSIMAYEISKKLKYTTATVATPLGKASAQVPERFPVLITILRAGLPFFLGFQDFFDQSDAGFIGAYRQEGKGHITIKLDYLATPEVGGREVILIDPMLATGRSLVDAVKVLVERGAAPSHMHIACLVASPEGLKFLKENLKTPYSIWSFAVDEKLDERFYIVPGLGDAGDLSFGNKI